MDKSKFLSKVIGIYLIFISISMFINIHQFSSLVSSMINNMPLMLALGCITLILGILMVVSHNVWQWNWRVIVTIVSWLILLKGASIVLYPQLIDKLSMAFVQNTNFAYIAAILDLILGLFLIYFGFKSIR